MNDDALLASVLRKLIAGNTDGLSGFAAMTALGLFCVDSSVDITSEEEAVVRRVMTEVYS